MEKIFLEGTKDTPEVTLDAETKVFKISKRSLPENANKFYQPIIDWISMYSANPDGDITFDFELDYLNTSSSKQITKILLLLEYLCTKVNVTVRWYFKKDDKDMQQSGDRFAKLIKVNFEVLELNY